MLRGRVGGGMLPTGRLMIVDASKPAHYDIAAGRSDQKCLVDTPLLAIRRSRPHDSIPANEK